MEVKIINYTEQQLWEKYLRESSYSAEELYEMMFPKLFFFTYSLYRDRETSIDLIQTEFGKLLEKQPKLKAEPGFGQTQILSNYLIGRIRRTWEKEGNTKKKKLSYLKSFLKEKDLETSGNSICGRLFLFLKYFSKADKKKKKWVKKLIRKTKEKTLEEVSSAFDTLEDDFKSRRKSGDMQEFHKHLYKVRLISGEFQSRLMEEKGPKN